MRELPSLAVRNVLTDMDDTLVGRTGGRGDGVFRDVLAEVIALARSLPREEAARLIAENLEPERECVSACLPRVGVEIGDYWRALIPRLREVLTLYPDAARMVRELHASRFDLYPATTNSGFAFLAKLAVGGLAEDGRTPYYRAVLGGAEVCPEGKRGPAFYRALMRRLDLDPALTVMVGDNPEADIAASREAGVAHAILIRRDQPEPCVEIEGGLAVRSLDTVPRLLRLA